ncbi:cell division topological specificity factor MinE [Fusobacteria bacterium ZRK30]|uniref:cell division topological specificity factor MinE n=1 Tax=Psychrilyobacter atlanticus TaxID=271091 RepID=UPI000407A9D4|nr:cell division topological specificity factor MinE [Psychrilyobacter atlanticus]UUV18971.1 cell division topological specificity factor MinE [Fusobacteria bacterium ZRK30]
MFEKLFGRKKSSAVAKDRLKLVLIHDRRLISNTVLNEMKDELIGVISKYIKIEQGEINIQFDVETENRNKGALIVNVPVKDILKK